MNRRLNANSHFEFTEKFHWFDQKNLPANDNVGKKKVEAPPFHCASADFTNQIYFGKVNNIAIAPSDFCLSICLDFYFSCQKEREREKSGVLAPAIPLDAWTFEHHTEVRFVNYIKRNRWQAHFICLTIFLKSIWWNEIAIWHIHKRLFQVDFNVIKVISIKS